MKRFVLVDDDPAWIAKVKVIITKVTISSDIDCDIKTYNTYNNDLIEEIKDDDEVKIYILDIDLKCVKNGINIAEEIRKYDWESYIIFLTNHDNMFNKVFNKIWLTTSFIVKFDNFEPKLMSVLQKILSYPRIHEILELKIKHDIYYIRLKNINYITRDTKNRTTIIKTINGEYKKNIPLKEIYKQLNDNFEYVSKSTIANKDNYKEKCLCKGYLIFQNDDIIYSVSKKYN